MKVPETPKPDFNASSMLDGVRASRPEGAPASPGSSREVRRADSTPAGTAAFGASVLNLTKQALSLPDVRTDRVSGLRDQLASGTYSASPGVTAGHMLADPLTGLGAGGRG